MSNYYLQTVQTYDWLLEKIEQSLAKVPDGDLITVERLRKLFKGRRPTDNDLFIVLQALSRLGVLRSGPGGYRLDSYNLEATTGYRRGVREALHFQGSETTSRSLCAVLPTGMPTRIEHELRMETTDLLHSLSEMIASAQSRIILASPFWDATTANELASLLLRRLAAGVDVDILSRFANNDDAGGIVLKKRLSGQPRCRLFRWYEEHGNSSGRQTFHFKAVAIDDGRRGWLGSANFTNSGLRMVMELGVILSGADAQSLYRVLNLVLDIARIIN